LHRDRERAPRGRGPAPGAGEGRRRRRREPLHAQNLGRPAQGLPPRAVRLDRQVSGDPMSDDDKRGGERVTINKEFESFDAFIQEYVTNISRSGVFIKTASPLGIGTSVNLRFTVIMDDIETI